MRCDEFEQALQRRLDREPVAFDETALRRHAAECAACRELEDGFRLLNQAFVTSRVPRPSQNLADRVFADVLSAPTTRRSWLIPALGLPAAASLLMALAWRSMPSWTGGELASRDPGAAIEGPTHRIDSASAGDDVLFPESDARDDAMLVVAVEPVSEMVRAVGRSLGSPVRPIAVSATEVLGSFFKDLPEPDAAMMPLPGMRERLPGPASGNKHGPAS